jgi:hypothetical protein
VAGDGSAAEGPGYGVPLKPGVYYVGPHQVSVERVGSDLLRYRGPSASALVSDSVSMVLVPMYPVLKPRFVTRMILLELEEPILVGPEESVAFYVKLPIDVAVYAEPAARGSFRVVDVLETSGRAKLTLYGPIHEGVVARLVRSRVYVEEPEPSVGYAVARIVFKNAGREVVSLSRVLLDSSPLKLYYEPGTWRAYTQEIVVSGTRDSAIVVYGDPLKGGLEEIKDPPELRPPRLFSRTDMPWGV